LKKDSYEESISNGLELAGIFTHKSLSDKLPKDSVGLFLNARKHLKRVYDYYSRKDIQQAMYKYALGRKITFLRYFSPMFDRLMRPDDILPLAMHTLLEKGRYWPSLHGTVSRYGVTGGQLCDLVIEIDYKSNWKT